MAKIFNNFKLYEEGVTDGIQQGQQLLLLQLLNKRFGNLTVKYIDLVESLDNNRILDITLNIFEINKLEELDRYFS